MNACSETGCDGATVAAVWAQLLPCDVHLVVVGRNLVSRLGSSDEKGGNIAPLSSPFQIVLSGANVFLKMFCRQLSVLVGNISYGWLS